MPFPPRQRQRREEQLERVARGIFPAATLVSHLRVVEFLDRE
jgi:hypothetical protein